MSALESMTLDDYRQRTARGEPLTIPETRRLEALMAKDRQEWENEPPPRWLGGDYPDVF